MNLLKIDMFNLFLDQYIEGEGRPGGGESFEVESHLSPLKWVAPRGSEVRSVSHSKAPYLIIVLKLFKIVLHYEVLVSLFTRKKIDWKSVSDSFGYVIDHFHVGEKIDYFIPPIFFVFNYK